LEAASFPPYRVIKSKRACLIASSLILLSSRLLIYLPEGFERSEPFGKKPTRRLLNPAWMPWSDISRGMHREHSGQSCVNSDERQMRAFWRQWQNLMSAG
jgi:hypothetical protein